MSLTILDTQLLETRINTNYFIVGKLTQLVGDQNQTQKLRTDISFNSSNKPNFVKNHMHFKKFNSANAAMTVVELQLYIAPQGFENDEHSTVADKLLAESIYVGSATIELGVQEMMLLKMEY